MVNIKRKYQMSYEIILEPADKETDSSTITNVIDTITKAVSGADGEISTASVIESLNNGKAMSSFRDVGETFGLVPKQTPTFGDPDEQL